MINHLQLNDTIGGKDEVWEICPIFVQDLTDFFPLFFNQLSHHLPPGSIPTKTNSDDNDHTLKWVLINIRYLKLSEHSFSRDVFVESIKNKKPQIWYPRDQANAWHAKPIKTLWLNPLPFSDTQSTARQACCFKNWIYFASQWFGGQGTLQLSDYFNWNGYVGMSP